MARDESSQDRLTKDTKVSAALDRAGSDLVVVRFNKPVREIAEAAAANASLRIISVIDAEGRLTGLIRVHALCDELFFNIAPEEFISEILEPGKLAEFGRILRAKTASELMEEPESVSLDDNVGRAFRRMHDRSLDGLPVLDASGHPVAYLDRLRLIAVWLKTHPSPASA